MKAFVFKDKSFTDYGHTYIVQIPNLGIIEYKLRKDGIIDGRQATKYPLDTCYDPVFYDKSQIKIDNYSKCMRFHLTLICRVFLDDNLIKKIRETGQIAKNAIHDEARAISKSNKERIRVLEVLENENKATKTVEKTNTQRVKEYIDTIEYTSEIADASREFRVNTQSFYETVCALHKLINNHCALHKLD